MNKTYTAEQVRKMLQRHIRNYYDSQAAYAADVNVSAAFVSAILKGKKYPSGGVLKSLGLKSKLQPPLYVLDN